MSIRNMVQLVGRPVDLSKGEWVSADGLPEPIYFPDAEPPEPLWYGCGEEHPTDVDCGTYDCHRRKGDDRK